MGESLVVWVTGASNGLGHALVHYLLSKGHRVAASVRPDTSATLFSDRRDPHDLLLLPGLLTDAHAVLEASAAIEARWGGLDLCLLNTGTCDYLPADVTANTLFASLAQTNRQAAKRVLEAAMPLLAKARRPRVLGLFSQASAAQQGDPTLPLSTSNSLTQWFREQRQPLQAQGIALSLIAPTSIKLPVFGKPLPPGEWSAEKAAHRIVETLPGLHPELVLEALNMEGLWPL
ncbi:SDR family NAD(P)-dependent oxidoreductase [Pseudomonas entomophila]|uniref:SDR family NAD(P)-dependent oxidoreductase n=1 Tax=Pseudomonas entomophila TaxID=312306 RepID=UPI0015E2B54F|nr:SDR family NAD(P)-dependent oxidoreductase [Pseudomonas entomophila]MBA1188970.1 SDR family NAD(P)-dependent oxidoreductase [Pseudomonas entomophila]